MASISAHFQLIRFEYPLPDAKPLAIFGKILTSLTFMTGTRTWFWIWIVTSMRYTLTMVISLARYTHVHLHSFKIATKPQWLNLTKRKVYKLSVFRGLVIAF